MTVTDQKKAKVLVQDYIAALREQGWTDDQILDDLKTELLRVSNEKKNWSEWKEFVLKWTSDIKGWSKPSCRLDYVSCLNALDYFIKHYRKVFIIPDQ